MNFICHRPFDWLGIELLINKCSFGSSAWHDMTIAPTTTINIDSIDSIIVLMNSLDNALEFPVVSFAILIHRESNQNPSIISVHSNSFCARSFRLRSAFDRKRLIDNNWILTTLCVSPRIEFRSWDQPTDLPAGVMQRESTNENVNFLIALCDFVSIYAWTFRSRSLRYRISDGVARIQRWRSKTRCETKRTARKKNRAKSKQFDWNLL